MYKCVNVCLIARRLQVYPLHSTVTLEEQNGVFLVPVPGYRKVKFTLKHTCMFRVFEGCNGLNSCCVCTYRLFSPQTSLRVLSLYLTLNTVGVYFHTFCEFLRSSYSSWYNLCIILCVCYAVIDFCLVRQLVCDKETNYRCLRITWASKTSCNQRRGAAYVG